MRCDGADLCGSGVQVSVTGCSQALGYCGRRGRHVWRESPRRDEWDAMSTAAQPTTTDTPHTDPSDLREMTNSPSGRLLVQRTLFTGPDTRIEPGMYADTDLSRVRLDRRRAHLGPGARLSANTYFGRFPALPD